MGRKQTRVKFLPGGGVLEGHWSPRRGKSKPRNLVATAFVSATRTSRQEASGDKIHMGRGGSASAKEAMRNRGYAQFLPALGRADA